MLTVYDKPAAGSGLNGRAGAQHIGPATVWIDLMDPSAEEDAAVETALGISIPTRAEMREIESSSRLYAENGATYMTAFVVSDIGAATPQTSTVTFILTQRRLVTVRYSEPKAISLFLTRVNKAMFPCSSGEDVMIGLVETLVSDTADLIERVQDEVEKLTAHLFQVKGGRATRDRRLDIVLRATGKEGDKVASAQEATLSMERMLNFFRDTLRRNGGGDDAVLQRSDAALTDIASLDDHMGFLTDRTSFLLQATLGMINIEQNQVIKLFSVMAVMLMPPTLVASIYGMNFQHMPELHWPWGYPAALAIMVVSAVIPFIYFRRKGWL